jgi:hypothetical protein
VPPKTVFRPYGKKQRRNFVITRTRRVYTSLLEISLFAAFAMLLVAPSARATPAAMETVTMSYEELDRVA